MPPPPLLLQTAELTKEISEAAGNVTKYTTDGLSALLWFLVLVLFGAVGALLYKIIVKDRAVSREDFAVLETKLSADYNRLEAAFKERKTSVDSDRMQDKLKFEQDLAAVANTLARLAKVAELQTTMAERIDWHGKELKRHEEEFKDMHEQIEKAKDQINKLYRELPRT